MKIAIMQPYFFAYLGYYQLVNSVDEFVVFDDVNFIKKGFINRNSILLNGKKFDFSIPVLKISQNRKINNHNYSGEFKKFERQIASSYGKSPNYSMVWSIIDKALYGDSLNVTDLNARSVNLVFEYLGIKKTISFSSDLSIPTSYKGQERIIEICKRKGATQYNNPIGGKSLYEKHMFKEAGITLQFLKSIKRIYPQNDTSEFIPNLSIIDVLMRNSQNAVLEMLNEYELC